MHSFIRFTKKISNKQILEHRILQLYYSTLFFFLQDQSEQSSNILLPIRNESHLPLIKYTVINVDWGEGGSSAARYKEKSQC